ncbi:histidine phosphatase family protein [Prochlorococcus sp. MIT 1307]|uniref:histidine phosphatase family protein n=1 Tax=Prochlorococcus sp. MIT 1307 TaxID=3096219 RepID=UPI002A75EA14|nr:histidine phosphatase family protein [Prochlorococcus sp. MIT 1307]
MTLRLLLVRHGLSSFNLERRIQGRNDLSTLTPEGKEQAIKTGKVLSNTPINAVYSSPLQRAADTTRNLLQEFKSKPKPNFDQGLLEIELGTWSGMTSDEVKENFPEIYDTWQTNPEELVLKTSNGKEFQPIKELKSQAADFIRRLIKEHPLESNDTILIVAHNAILRCIILQLLGQPKQGFRRLKLDNASISVFNLSPSLFKPYQAQLECLNNTVHLNSTLHKNSNYARVILVRHGETNWNLEGRFQGQIDIPLNDNGKAQAAAAGLFLSMVRLEKAFSSSMSRPQQTAQAILKHHPGIEIELQEGLIEIGHGLWEGKLESEIRMKWPELLETWKTHPEKVQMPEGETIQDVWARAENSWEKICSSLTSAQTALVVAHDAVNKTILCKLLGLSPADIWMIKQGNGAITVVDIPTEPTQPNVVTCLNLTSHLGGVFDCTTSGAL